MILQYVQYKNFGKSLHLGCQNPNWYHGFTRCSAGCKSFKFPIEFSYASSDWLTAPKGPASRVRPRFFDQVGHETIYASSGNKHFFTKSCHCQTYHNYEQPCKKDLKNLSFKVIFECLKLVESFQKKISKKNIRLGDQLLSKMFLKILIFKILYFLKLCPIFVGSDHNFDRSDNDRI